MKTKFKSKLLSILLVLVMVLALVPFSSITALAVTNGTGTQQSPLTVTTYEELKAALADNTTQYIVVNDFETNYDDGNGGFYQINQAIAEDYALYSNPAVDKHLTINTAVRISTSAQCTNVKTGLEVGGNLTIDGTGIFNMSFYDTESRCVVVNVPKSGKLIVNGQVTIDATSVRHSNEINQEAESIHSKGHIVFNGGTFIGYFSRVSSTMGSVCAVYVEAGRSEYYGGNFKTVNHSAVDNGVQIDKGCEGGVILINRPSANGTKKVPELTKLKGGTFQSIVIVNYEDTSDVIGNLLVGCRLYDADDKHELDDYYALNYVHNATVLKYNLDITFDANGGKGVMNKVTFNTLSNDYFTLPESGFYAPTGKRFKCWSIDGIEKAVGETFEPTKDTVISALWVDIPANELGGKGTKESPLYVNTYAELKAALADDVTEYIIVKDFLYTNDGGYHLINNPIDGEDYALWSNPDIHKHLTIDTKVRLGVYLACPNITKGIEVAGKLTIDGSGSFNTSFLSNKRGTVINVTSTGTLIVEDPVTIDATSIWHTEQHNIEAEAIHSKGHLTINGGTFKGHFDRVSSTSVTLNAVYVEAGKAEFYGGDFRTVNTRTSVDKGCEGGLLVVSNPSANNGKDINELIKLDGGTYQRFAVFSLGNKQWKASDLMFGSYFLDAETGNEIAANFYDTTYIPNLRVVKHTYHVWFDSNGGEGSMSMVTLNNKNYKLPPCDITAPTGMKFKGWAVNSADSDDIYHTDENFVLKGDTVLYAAWEKNVIDEVKINTTEPTAGNYIGDQEISILTDDSSLSIYAHEWYESEEILTTFETFESGKTYRLKVRIATTKSFTNDAKVYVNGEEATVSSCDGSSILFYYDFTLPSYGYTITFGADGGTGEMAAIPDASGEYTLPVCRFAAPRGKQFKVWKVNGVEKAVGDKIVITADTTIIAVWEELPTAMVSYHENGGSGTMVGDVVTIGDKFTLENCTYIAPKGYQFKAWAIGSVNGEQKQPGEQITITGETYIYAVWEDITYTVSFNANGGTGSMLDETEQLGGYVLPECTFTAPTGKQFKCWAEGSASGAQYNVSYEYDVTANVTFYAVWEVIPHECVGVAENGQGATCTVDGWKDYYRCECGKYYEDADCQIPINDLEAWKVGAGKTTKDHEPNADDGDCTTAITCSVCGTVTTAANAAHTGGTATCEKKAECEVCGKEYGNLANHIPNADDGDCTTDITCSVCGEVTTEGADAHTGGTATCEKKAECEVCGKEYGNLANHIPNADDGDCTTDITCSVCGEVTTEGADAHTGGTATCEKKAKCEVCGKEYGEFAAHIPNADDGDCTTDITCSVCGDVTTEGANSHTGGTATCTQKAECTVCGKEYGELAAHIPNADDGDCTTDITCSVCGEVTTEGADAHTGGTATCEHKAECTVCGKEYGNLANHIPNADDGDCTTDITCSVCGDVTTEGADSHTGGTATCTQKAECTVCGKEYGNLANHIPNADDGDCTTAITCSVCGTVTTAANATHTASADDGDCTTAVKCTQCDRNAIEAKATHTGGTATCTQKAECTVCGKEYGNLANHIPNADDGDCTTAITCSVCGTVTTAANAAHTAGADDGDCTTAVKCTKCDKNAIEANATHTGGTATCTQKAECTVCGKEYGSFGDHNYGALIEAVAEKHTKTELVAGVAAHYQCPVCDKYFTSAKVETTLQALTGETPSHSYGTWQTNDDKHWKECSCGLKSEENDHVYDNATDVTCNTCDHDRTLPHTHGNGVKQLGQSATCTAPGWNDYYKCSCGKFYTEAACTNEITDLAAWKTGAGKIEASHNYGTLVSAVTEKHTQTELVAGVAAHYHCSACGKYFTEGKVETTLEALTGTTPSHSYGDWKTDADKHWKECSCGKKADEGNHVDANSNNKCDTCDKTLSGGVTPPPHTHDYGTTWKSDGTNHWKECSCGDMKEVTAHSGGTATCTAKAKCSECNTEYGELAEHKYSEATCTAKAKCSVCGDEKGELAAHTYVDGKCACGATDPNYVPPHEHNFIEGKCECGETDPNYTPGTDTPGTDVPGTDVPGTDKPEDPDDGLSGGAIAGIVAGSVVVLGGGGFALWWFVFRKKKLF